MFDDIVADKRKPPGINLDNSKLKEPGWNLSTDISDEVAKTLFSSKLIKA